MSSDYTSVVGCPSRLRADKLVQPFFCLTLLIIAATATQRTGLNAWAATHVANTPALDLNLLWSPCTRTLPAKWLFPDREYATYAAFSDVVLATFDIDLTGMGFPDVTDRTQLPVDHRPEKSMETAFVKELIKVRIHYFLPRSY